jgi:hypothetical protein
MSDASTPQTAPENPVPGVDPLSLTRTHLGKKWLTKMAIFMIVLFGFGTWGLFDAVYLYPRRGLMDASAKLRDMMAAAQDIGQLGSGNIRIPDLRAKLKELDARETQIRTAAVTSGGGGGGAGAARLELAKLEWLKSLSRAWSLNPSPKPLLERDGVRYFYEPLEGTGYTVGADGTRKPQSPAELYNELRNKWDKTKTVTPLSGFDMLLQWVFAVIGYVGGTWILVMLLRASRTVFTWDPPTQTLSLPGGAKVSPADLKDIDKQKWHKYFVTLETREGARHELDLLRYVPLEEWVLAMEKAAFPERVREEAEKKAAEEAAKA